MKNLTLITCLFLLSLKLNAQKDQITLKSAETLKVKIIEINPSHVKFQKTLDGPIYSLNKSEVFVIIYEDGRKELFDYQNSSNSKKQNIQIEIEEEEKFAPSRHYGGPRIGATFIDAGISRQRIASAFNRGEIQPVITQFGWQFETQIFRLEDGSKALVEFVPMIGGLEQGLFIPSGTGIIGYRSKNGVEFGMGPSLSLGGVGVAFAAGFSFKSGPVTFPVDLVFSPSIIKTNKSLEKSQSSSNLTLVIGFITYKK